jgi:hypothetical protein
VTARITAARARSLGIEVPARKRGKAKLPRVDAAVGLAMVLMLANFTEFVREHRFAPPRRWRFDVAWPDRLFAVEVDGGVWTCGRHVRGKGFEADCRKLNEAALMGWRVLRVTPAMVKSGEALALVEREFGTFKRPVLQDWHDDERRAK